MDDLRRVLQAKADGVHLDPQLPPSLRVRARRRRVLNAAVTLAVVGTVGFGSYAGFRAINTDDLSGQHLMPAEPPISLPPGRQAEPITWIYPEKPGQVQDLVDQGQNPTWTDPVGVARRFAAEVLNWDSGHTEARARGDDPVTVEISNPSLAEDNGIPSDLRITLEMLRWRDDGIYFIRTATSDLLSLASPPGKVEFSLGKDAPLDGFGDALDFSGSLSYVPVDGVIAVELRSETLARGETFAADTFHIQASGQVRVNNGRTIASAALRNATGQILAYTAYPVFFAVAEEDRVMAPCESGGPSAPGVDFQEGPAAIFPDAVSETRAGLMQAAHDRDWKALARFIPETDFTFTYGTERDPIAYWKSLEASGTRVLHILTKLMCYTGSEYEGVYSFPEAAEKPPSEWTEGDMAPLREIYSAQELDRLRRQDSYYGWRVGIEPDGTWVFFVSGD